MLEFAGTIGNRTATIAELPHDNERQRQLIGELIHALELCLASDGLTWEAEQEAEIMVRRAKEIA